MLRAAAEFLNRLDDIIVFEPLSQVCLRAERMRASPFFSHDPL
jgi:hypothetical protein